MNKLNKQTRLNVKHYCFTFQQIVHIHLNIYPTYQQVSECLVQKNAGCIQIVPLQQHFLDYKQIYTKHVLMVS